MEKFEERGAIVKSLIVSLPKASGHGKFFIFQSLPIIIDVA